MVLAWPVILSRVGILMMTTVDVIVVGRAGADQLAFYVLGYAIYDSLVAMVAGLHLGVPTLVSRTIGAGAPVHAALVWKRGLVSAIVIGSVIALIVQGAPWLFTLLGQDRTLAEGGGEVTALLGMCLPFFGLFLVSAMFLEALEKPLQATLAVLLANVLNLGLSITLVFGIGPIPALGAWGCALATLVTASFLGVGLYCYVFFGLRDRQRYGIGTPTTADADQAVHAPTWREQSRVGLASGVSYGLEAGSFTALTLIAGLLGVIGLAAMGVLFQLFAVTFMISFGIAGATQVRVGNAWGRGSLRDMVWAGWAGFSLSVFCSLVFCALFLLAPRWFLGILTTDEAVLLAAAPVMVWMVAALIADGGQTVLNHACRGRGDSWVPTLAHLVSYWAIMVPLGWVLAVHLGGGPLGLYQAILLSSVFSLFAMAMRFVVLSRRGLPDVAVA
ncbi:MAG: MATE family efflux transporter [Pseudomonadota bacterium]